MTMIDTREPIGFAVNSEGGPFMQADEFPDGPDAWFWIFPSRYDELIEKTGIERQIPFRTLMHSIGDSTAPHLLLIPRTHLNELLQAAGVQIDYERSQSSRSHKEMPEEETAKDWFKNLVADLSCGNPGAAMAILAAAWHIRSRNQHGNILGRFMADLEFSGLRGPNIHIAYEYVHNRHPETFIDALSTPDGIRELWGKVKADPGYDPNWQAQT